LHAETQPWGDTTIRGQVDRGTGLLNNTLYIGRLSWDRCSYVKDPRTGKRVARPRNPEEWETTDVPALRIVEQTVWDAVKVRQSTVRFAISRDEAGNALNRAHRRNFLLSAWVLWPRLHNHGQRSLWLRDPPQQGNMR
jgi:site-specific DNA recombinase